MIGVALVVLGVAMLFGYKLPISTPRLDAGGRRRTVGSMFVYGVAYAVASIGCTIGLFIATLLGSTRSDGVMSGVANVVAYGAGMALVVTALTITLAVANTGLLRVLRTGMRHVESIAAVFVVLSGLYLVYYFWVVDVNEDAAPITNRVEDLQNWIIVRLSDNWQTSGARARRDRRRRDPVRGRAARRRRRWDDVRPPSRWVDAPATGLPSPP